MCRIVIINGRSNEIESNGTKKCNDMKTHFIFVCIVTFFLSCKINSIPLQNEDFQNIEDVKVEVVESGKSLKLTNRDSINNLFENYINNNSRESAKFVAIYRITVNYKDRSEIYLVNGNRVNFKGLTYKMNRNIDDLFQKLR